MDNPKSSFVNQLVHLHVGNVEQVSVVISSGSIERVTDAIHETGLKVVEQYPSDQPDKLVLIIARSNS